MWLRTAHAEFDLPTLRQFIKENPLGTFVTAIESPEHPTIQSTNFPFVISVEDEASEKELGKLRGHMSKPNPHAKTLIEEVQKTQPSNGSITQEVYILFPGPAAAYVTPKFYTETKPSTGRVVGTWNYSAVQVYGTATIYYDTKNEETGKWLQQQIADLSSHAELNIAKHTGEGDRPKAWHLGEAPVSYVELLKKNIIGIEVDITRLEGKFKMSQEMSKGDRMGVVEGFKKLGTPLGDEISKTVENRGVIRDEMAARGVKIT